MRVADSVCPIRLLFAGRDLVLREIPVALNQRQKTVGPWASPAVRAVRLGGLCVVAAAGLMAAGGLVARQPGPGAVWAVLALLVLPALALGTLAFHREVYARTPRASEGNGRG